MPMMNEEAELQAASRNGSAERMRRHRQRRRDGLQCFMVELRATEVDTLVRSGLLEAEKRSDTDAVLEALYTFLNRTLGNWSDA